MTEHRGHKKKVLVWRVINTQLAPVASLLPTKTRQKNNDSVLSRRIKFIPRHRSHHSLLVLFGFMGPCISSNYLGLCFAFVSVIWSLLCLTFQEPSAQAVKRMYDVHCCTADFLIWLWGGLIWIRVDLWERCVRGMFADRLGDLIWLDRSAASLLTCGYFKTETRKKLLRAHASQFVINLLFIVISVPLL